MAHHEEVFLKHILDEINFLLEETENIDIEKVKHDEVLKRACARSLEIIGEATKNISQDIKNQYRDIDWKRLAGLRDKIIHYYFGLDWDILWDVIKNKLPELKDKIKIIINKIEG